jgi:hypothetical protein
MAAFTTIAAGVGLAATAATTGISFGQAAKQKDLAKKSQRKANKAMKEARARLEVNYADALSIPKEAYELQREAMLSQGAQALEAGIESERGSAATAGRVLAAQQAAQSGIRTDMAQELFDIEAMKLEEDSRLRDINVQMDIGEAMGAQQRAADAQAASTAAKQQGIQEAISLGEQAMSFIPLYAQDRNAQKGAAEAAGLYDPNTNFRKFKKENKSFRSNPEYMKAYRELTQPFDVTGQSSIAAPVDNTISGSAPVIPPANFIPAKRVGETLSDFTADQLDAMKLLDSARYDSLFL